MLYVQSWSSLYNINIMLICLLNNYLIWQRMEKKWKNKKRKLASDLPKPSVSYLQNFVEGCNFAEYPMQADFFFEGNKITSNDDKRAVLFTAIRKKSFSFLRNLLQPRDMKSVSYNEIITVLTDYYPPSSSVIMERFHSY